MGHREKNGGGSDSPRFKNRDVIWLLDEQMKKIILFIVLSFFIVSDVSASEIFGSISTNPKAPGGGGNPPAIEPPKEVVSESGGAVILPAAPELEIKTIESRPTALEPKVLGVKTYPDGSLLRGSDQRIYLIYGQRKKYIPNLLELAKYRGRAILKITDQELAGYETRSHLDGELIRQKGDAKVYVIRQGLKQHILNLAELRAYYFGQEIFNLSREQMESY